MKQSDQKQHTKFQNDGTIIDFTERFDYLGMIPMIALIKFRRFPVTEGSKSNILPRFIKRGPTSSHLSFTT